jgi:hypothetical protein
MKNNAKLGGRRRLRLALGLLGGGWLLGLGLMLAGLIQFILYVRE